MAIVYANHAMCVWNGMTGSGMADRVSQMRRRKLAGYADYLGHGAGLSPLEAPVDAMAYLHALAIVVEQAPPQMALEIGAARRLAELGIVGHLILSAPDLRETLELWQRHAEMAGELARMSSRVSGVGARSRWSVHFEPLPFLAPALARFVVEELVATFFAFAREVTGARLDDFTVDLPFRRTRGVDYEFFLCPQVRFEQREAVIAGPASALALRQVAHDAETFDALGRRLREEAGRVSALDLGAALRDGFLARPGEAPNLGRAARRMGLSARTLSRHLAQQGTSFAQVLSEYRRTVSQDLLASGSMSVAEVAFLLGYRSESGLRRAFVEWTGMPIGRWRRTLRQQKGSLA